MEVLGDGQGERCAGRGGAASSAWSWQVLPGRGDEYTEPSGRRGARRHQQGHSACKDPEVGLGRASPSSLQLRVGSGPWGRCWSGVQRPGDGGRWALWRRARASFYRASAGAEGRELTVGQGPRVPCPVSSGPALRMVQGSFGE